uniref:SURP motif domain-containing protein n=1 Tax=Kalanchoe fedtschenkoi TaxID=63787 RepID=A0A7N1A4T7_KALFE
MDRSSDSKRKVTLSAPSGKLAFSLKPKSKLIAPPVKFGGDDEEDEIDVGNSADRSVKRQKATQSNVSEQPSKSADVAPTAPSDPTVKKVADKLASFVAKNGRQFEHVTRQKNPGDTPFKFLFDESCADYKYYEYRLIEEEKVLSQTSNKGEGLGSSRNGIADPIMAGSVKKDTLGVGASQPGEVTPDDDIYEQYKKRMMLGYRHRPNPLGNPRKAYY